jgi:glycosyltransferase involved in cell wall biosynthesis
MDIKISLITVTFNAQATIERCILSVINQTYKNVEYIIIDGCSTDNTSRIVKKYDNYVRHFISEPDKGIYDAMNKGIKLATGDVVGMINADDYFADDNVLLSVAGAFNEQNTPIVYGDLDFIGPRGNTVRKWRSGKYSWGMFNGGWMPPHPTFYCRRQLFNEYGFYSLDYGTAADYELMLRFMHKYRLNAFYLKKIIICMKTGGASNKNLSSRVEGLINDFKVIRQNGIKMPLIVVILKRLRKIGQYL